MLYKSLREWCQALINKKKRKSKILRAALRTLSPLEREVIETHYYGKPIQLRLAEVNRQCVLETAQIKLSAYLEQSKANTLSRLKEREEQALRKRVQPV